MAFCLAAVSLPANAQPADDPSDAPVAGTALVDYLARLRAQGLVVIYSSELVPDSLRLESEPIGATPRIRLASVLSRLGLALERGPQDTWLIVRESVPGDAPAAPVQTLPAVRVPPPIENVIVTASRYAFTRDPVASGSLVDRLQLETVPEIGDDALRPIANIPGVSGNGLSGRMAIRGGNADETLMVLDGVELMNPFHLKDFESIFGSISPRIIESMDVYTGGFSTRYGGRMSGVVDMRAIEPEESRHFELGVSTINSSFLSSGKLEENGDWLVSLRRGTVDLLLDAVDSDFGSPQFSDFFGRVTRNIGTTGQLRFGILSLNDKIALTDGTVAQAGADYDDNYVWAGYTHDIGDALSAQYLLWIANSDSKRNGATSSADTSFGRLSDVRENTSLAIKADWRYERSARQLIEWGIKVERSEARYDFVSLAEVPFPIAAPMPGSGAGNYVFAGAFDDTESAAFFNFRQRVRDDLTIELGARVDLHSINDDRELSPRVGAVWDISEHLALRAAWGKYTQAQRIDELHVSDGLAQLFNSQRSEQRVLSLEFEPNDRMMVRAELFDKRFSNLNPRFENLYMRLSLVPELLPDRVRLTADEARAFGVEVSLNVDLNDWRWWLSYARNNAEDRIEGQWIRRSWQEAWATKAGFIWTHTKWDIGATLIARSGWPISQPELRDGQIVVDAFNDRAFEKFRSLDVKATRNFTLRHGRIELFAELINVLDDNNDCCYEQVVDGDPLTGARNLQLDTLRWLPSVPVVGFLWSF